MQRPHSIFDRLMAALQSVLAFARARRAQARESLRWARRAPDQDSVTVGADLR